MQYNILSLLQPNDKMLGLSGAQAPPPIFYLIVAPLQSKTIRMSHDALSVFYKQTNKTIERPIVGSMVQNFVNGISTSKIGELETRGFSSFRKHMYQCYEWVSRDN